MNPLEKQLQSWAPRRPSARLKERIFAPQTPPQRAVAAESSPAMSAWLKFAPACCILLLAMWFGSTRQEKTAYLAVAGGSNVLASLSSNLLTLCATDFREQRENLWMKASFDWTNVGHSPSTTGSFPSWNTNVHKL